MYDLVEIASEGNGALGKQKGKSSTKYNFKQPNSKHLNKKLIFKRRNFEKMKLILCKTCNRLEIIKKEQVLSKNHIICISKKIRFLQFFCTWTNKDSCNSQSSSKKTY